MSTDLEWDVRKVLGEIPMAYPCGSYRLQKAHCREDRAGGEAYIAEGAMQGLVWPAYGRASRELVPCVANDDGRLLKPHMAIYPTGRIIRWREVSHRPSHSFIRSDSSKPWTKSSSS